MLECAGEFLDRLPFARFRPEYGRNPLNEYLLLGNHGLLKRKNSDVPRGSVTMFCSPICTGVTPTLLQVPPRGEAVCSSKPVLAASQNITTFWPERATYRGGPGVTTETLTVALV